MTDMKMDKAVILARGLGTRMRKADAGAVVTDEQAQIADSGVKAMIPIDRPFLDYVLHDLAEAGYQRVCMVIGPEHTRIRDYYHQEVASEQLSIEFAIQDEPLGTADAVRAAESFAGDDYFLVINSDNYYPAAVLARLRELEGCALAAFDRKTLIAESNIPEERVTRFAVIEIDEAGDMTRIIEKPSAEVLAAIKEPLRVSMNCWRFGPSIFEGCRTISPSPRGEYEIPDAVQYTIEQAGERYHALPVKAPVLDLSSRSDIHSVSELLAGKEVVF